MRRHGRLVAGLALGLIAIACAAPAPARAQTGEWVSLFDGKSMEGWEVLALPGQQPTKWEVVDGALTGSGGASMIFSPKGDYKNFKFRAEVKINDKGNSGLYFRTPKAPSFGGGYECQINATHSDPIKSGSLYTFVHLYDASKLPAPDTYFVEEVEVRDATFRGKPIAKIKVSIDGKVLYEFNDFDRTWKDGYFAFQQHDPGSKVSIRKVEVMELPASK